MIPFFATSNFRTEPARFIILALILISVGIFGIHNLSEIWKKDSRPRQVIVTLIRSTDRSILLTINMIHSITKFHPTNSSHIHSFLIFHDHNFTSAMRQQILSCVLKTNKKLQISFVLVNFHTKVKPENGSHPTKSIEYRIMCRFWSYDVFYHPAIIRGHYDYLMRMDDDSYFTDVMQTNLFSYMKSENLDYIYRTTYSESMDPMLPIFHHFLNGTSGGFNCIYNNFFIMRLQWFYESKPMQSFLHVLTQNDLMLRQYIGDGCVHAAMLKLDNQVNAKHVTDISYGHNWHLAPAGQPNCWYREVNGFKEELENSCQQLTVLRGREGTLTKINML